MTDMTPYNIIFGLLLVKYKIYSDILEICYIFQLTTLDYRPDCLEIFHPNNNHTQLHLASKPRQGQPAISTLVKPN